MSVTLWERAKSRDAVIDLRAGQTVFEYVALCYPPFAVSDNVDLLAAVNAQVPGGYGFQQKRTVDAKHQGGPLWHVTVTYGFDEGESLSPGAGNFLPYEFSFDTTGGTQHITQSLKTVTAVAYGVQGNGIRTFSDGFVTDGSNQLTSLAGADFTSADVGRTVVGLGIPAGTTITAFTSSTDVTMSADATASTGMQVIITYPSRHCNDAITTAGSNILTSATSFFTLGDVGRTISGFGIPDGTKFTGFLSSQQMVMSVAATASTANLFAYVTATRTVTDAQVTNGFPTLASASAGFTSEDVASELSGPGIPAGALIMSVINATSVVMDSSATASTNGETVEILYQRGVADTVTTAGSKTVTSATAHFTNADVGATVFAMGFVAGRIVTVNGPNSVTLDTAATATGAGLAMTISVADANPPNYNQTIGVSVNGVAGTDIVAPKTELQITRDFTGVTANYISAIASLTGTVNNAPFFGFASGVVLFLGAVGAPSQNNQAAAAPLVRITFRFALAFNQTNIDIVPLDANGNPLLRVPTLNGWDYLWCAYGNQVVNNTNISRPTAAYVEQVYRYTDFSQLLIGVG